jgi:hypothetical protein
MDGLVFEPRMDTDEHRLRNNLHEPMLDIINMNWPKLVVGVCALGIFFAALSYYVFIGIWATQERVEEEGNVRFGVHLQALVDDFKHQFGRFPTPNELTNLFTMAVYGGPLALSSQLDNSGRWYYDEKSGEVRINSRRIYYIGLASRINLFDTTFRRPTKVAVSHFGKIETWDYTRLNDLVDLEMPQISQILTNWYATNRWK